MQRIFFTLAIISTLLFVASLMLGIQIGDPAEASAATRSALSTHLLTSVGALIFAALVHAVLLTYFMGTGRWIEETSAAYGLGSTWREQSRALKYRAIPPMAACLALLIVNIPFGALAVDEKDWSFGALGTIHPATFHFVLAVATVVVNALVNAVEYRAIVGNARLISEVVAQVKAIRQAKGLPT